MVWDTLHIPYPWHPLTLTLTTPDPREERGQACVDCILACPSSGLILLYWNTQYWPGLRPACRDWGTTVTTTSISPSVSRITARTSQFRLTMSDWLSLLILVLCQAGGRGGSQTAEPSPQFDSHLPAKLTVQQGDTAYLPCRIFSAQNMWVNSWVVSSPVSSLQHCRTAVCYHYKVIQCSERIRSWENCILSFISANFAATKRFLFKIKIDTETTTRWCRCDLILDYFCLILNQSMYPSQLTEISAIILGNKYFVGQASK